MNYEYSQVFNSLEGEGPLAGVPTTYIRFARCNFQCKGFNNPTNLDPSSPAVLKFDPSKITGIQDIPEITVGCDSIYSVHTSFKHIWFKGDEQKLAEETMKFVPHNQWINPISKKRTMLSLTGGEPTLRWKTIPTLLNHPLFDELEVVLIETNCAVAFKDKFIEDLADWINNGTKRGLERKIIWSNSPKLAISGEVPEEAIRPDVALMQRRLRELTSPNNVLQYFKFVCGPEQSQFDEVKDVMDQYYAAGIPFNETDVLIMPVACTEEQQSNIAADVADMCIHNGYVYTHRVHNSVYNNALDK